MKMTQQDTEAMNGFAVRAAEIRKIVESLKNDISQHMDICEDDNEDTYNEFASAWEKSITAAGALEEIADRYQIL
jgi:hypothetical protein